MGMEESLINRIVVSKPQQARLEVGRDGFPAAATHSVGL